jgi:hypothetical protein
MRVDVVPAMDAPVFDVPIAVIAVVPNPLASAKPAELTVETFTSLEDQVTVSVTS